MAPAEPFPLPIRPFCGLTGSSSRTGKDFGVAPRFIDGDGINFIPGDLLLGQLSLAMESTRGT